MEERKRERKKRERCWTRKCNFSYGHILLNSSINIILSIKIILKMFQIAPSIITIHSVLTR